MILHSIQLQEWRCFVKATSVGPFSDGLNVIHAPNASGKSTLFQALISGLIDNHRARGRDVEALRPWGRSLAPLVTIEFSHNGICYRLTKGFLEKAQCKLERKEDGKFVPFAEEQHAEQFVQKICTENPPQKGLGRKEHWGFAQVLWAPQGDLAFLKLSGDLVSNIHQVLGTQVSGPGSGNLERRIAELYYTFYTQRGKLRSGQGAPELVRLQESLDEAKGRRDEIAGRQEEFEELTRKVEDLRTRQVEAARSAKEIEKRLAETRPKAEEYDRLLSTRSEREEQVNTAEAQHDALKQRIDHIIKTKNGLSEAGGESKNLKEDLSLRESSAKECRLKAERATRDLEDKRKERPKVQAAQRETELAQRYVQIVQDASKLEQRLRKIRKFDKALGSLRKERGKLVAPDDKNIKAIRTATKARDEARLRLDAALITLQVVPSSKGSLTILEAEESGTRILIPQEPVEIKGSPQVVIDLAGVARVRAWGPAGSIDEMRRLVEKHTRKLDKLSEAFGTSDLDVLERLNEAVKKLEAQMAEQNMQIEAILAGDVLEDLEKQLVSSQTTARSIERQKHEWQKKMPDLESLKEDAEAITNKFITEVEAVEQYRDVTHTALAVANEQKIETTTRLDETKKRIQSLHGSLSELTKDGKTDAQREKEIARIALKWDAAKSTLEEVQGKLNVFEHDPRADLEKFEGGRKGAEEAVRKALSDEKREEGRLEQLSAQGTYSALANIEEKIIALSEEVSREQLHADAVKLLYDTMEQCQKKVLAAIERPVEQTATRTLQRIAGRRLGNIKLGEYFEPTSVLPQKTEESVSISSVSGGEKEQIYLATRLALAEVLANEEKQLVVLDDVLMATDPWRLGRVLGVLEETSEKLQIIMLTCHPERYGALKEAKFIDLEEILRRVNIA